MPNYTTHVAFTEDGTSQRVVVNGPATVFVNGTLGGGTITMKVGPGVVADDSIMEDVESGDMAAITAAGYSKFPLHGKFQAKFVMAGSTDPDCRVYIVDTDN